MTIAIVITILVIGMSTAIGVAGGSYLKSRNLEGECYELWEKLAELSLKNHEYAKADTARQQQRLNASKAAAAKRRAFKETAQ